jgi:L-arabinonolactonase
MEATPPAVHEQAGYALWCERTQRLLWSDAAAAQLRAWSPATGQTRAWRLPESLGCFALTASVDRLLLGFASRLAVLDLANGALVPVGEVEAGQGTRIADGRCDRQGRFVFGTGADDARAPRGGFYRLNHDLSIERLPLGEAGLAAGICFSPDGRTMYYADALAGAVRRCAYHPCSGEISHPRPFVAAGAAPGEPGGAAVDADGHVWSARRGAAQLVRFAPDGSIERALALAAPQPAWPVFGGPRCATLFVTATHAGLSGRRLAAAREAGGILALAPAVSGLAEQRFLGRLPSRV